jgi:hypothetical protein
VLNVGHDQLVQHDTMAGDHGLDHVAWLERNDCLHGCVGALVLTLPGLTGSFADGLGYIAGYVGDDVREAESRLRFHEWGFLG